MIALAPEPQIQSVALFAPAWPAGEVANGIVSYVSVLRDALRRVGVSAIVLASRLDSRPEAGVLPLDEELKDASIWRWRSIESALRRRIDPERTRAIQVDSAIARALGRGGSEVSLIEMEESFGWASRVARRRVFPVVVRLHGPWFLNGAARGVPIDARFRRRDRAERGCLIAASAVSAPCRDVLERTRRHFELPLEDAVVIPNPIEPVPESARWRLDASDPAEVVFVGRFDRHKGGDTLIEAFARVAAERPKARLTFVGPDQGVVDPRGRRWTLEEFAADRLGSARSRLRWLGRQPSDRVQELRRRASVVVVASRYENFPYAALEAMAMGCPLVSTRAGGLVEVVEDSRNALTCEPNDPAGLSRCILALLDDGPLSARLGAQASRDSRERYNPDVVARATLDFYRDMLARTRSS
jgi:glycosyltransferase involved in cell wall biosynthesis